MPLMDDATAPIDPEDVDETYDSAPDGGLKARFDVPWYVHLTGSRTNVHGAGAYGLRVPWKYTDSPGTAGECIVSQPVTGITGQDARTTKGALTPETVGSIVTLHGHDYDNITMAHNDPNGLGGLAITSYRSTNSASLLMPGPMFPERTARMYRVPRAGGVEQTLVVAAAGDAVSGTMNWVDEQAIGLSALTRAKTKAYGVEMKGRAEGLYFELVATCPAGIVDWSVTFTKWRLVAVTDAQDANGGTQVLGTSTTDLPTKPGERRAMTLRVEGGVATCYVDGKQILSADIPGTLLTNDYAPPGPPQQAWFHAGAGNMYVGPHTWLKTPDNPVESTTYRGTLTWLVDQYVAHKAGHLGVAWSSTPNHKAYLPTTDEQKLASLPASRLGQPPVVLTTVPDGAAMQRMGVRATVANLGGGTSRTFWQAETPLPTDATPTFSPDLHATFNAQSGDGLLMAVLVPEYNGPDDEVTPACGLVVRGRAQAKTFLMVEVFASGGVKWPGSEVRSHMVKLWAYKSDGTRTLLQAGSVLPPLAYDYVTDAYPDARQTFGSLGTTSYLALHAMVKTVGNSIKVYLVPKESFAYLLRPHLILQHTLTGNDATTYGPDAPMVGFSTMRQVTTSRTGQAPYALTYVTKDPVNIVPDPPQVIEDPTDEPTDVGPGDDTQVDVPIPPGGETTIKNGPDGGDGNGDGKDGGTEIKTKRDDDGKTKTVIIIKDPDGGPDVIIEVPDWIDAKPGDPLWFRVQWINGKIVIWFNGVIWFTYTLTADDLSKLGVSRKYISFWDGTTRVAPPAGTVIIRGQWTPTSLTMMVVVPTRMVAMGSAKDRLWGRVNGFSRPQVLIVGADDSVVLTDEPDDELLAAASHVFGGGRATNNIVSPDVANLIGAAGYGDLLKEIAT